tara:strand:+ start:65 stop:601 length:537 start_codon:yes stop_codon:yes gene_type:complete
MGFAFGGTGFNSSDFVKKEKDKSPFDLGGDDSPFSLGDLYKSDISKDFSDKIGVNNPFVEKGDGKGFLSKQMDNYKSYLDATKDDKSESDKDRDLIRDLANKQELKFGDMTKGFSSEVAQGLNMYQPPSPNQQMFIPGQQGGKSFGQRLAGAAVGLGKGLMTGVPHGGAFGAVSGFFG